MWFAARIKKNCSEIFKRDLKKKINKDIVFYEPKLSLKTKVKGKWILNIRPLIEGYIFCKLNKSDGKIDLGKFLYTKGLKYF